jgi:hypothetical protein
MSTGTELTAAVFGQRVHPILFFFWGCLKDKVYNSNPQTEDLNENIRREITNIPAEQLSKGKSEPLPQVRGMSTCRRTACSTPPVICKL